eukprot:3647944-Rhodomonas_salina.1
MFYSPSNSPNFICQWASEKAGAGNAGPLAPDGRQRSMGGAFFPTTTTSSTTGYARGRKRGARDLAAQNAPLLK